MVVTLTSEVVVRPETLPGTKPKDETQTEVATEVDGVVGLLLSTQLRLL